MTAAVVCEHLRFLSRLWRSSGEAQHVTLGRTLALLAVASLGIFLGAMLTEGLVLVP